MAALDPPPALDLGLEMYSRGKLVVHLGQIAEVLHDLRDRVLVRREVVRREVRGQVMIHCTCMHAHGREVVRIITKYGDADARTRIAVPASRDLQGDQRRRAGRREAVGGGFAGPPARAGALAPPRARGHSREDLWAWALATELVKLEMLVPSWRFVVYYNVAGLAARV